MKKLNIFTNQKNKSNLLNASLCKYFAVALCLFTTIGVNKASALDVSTSTNATAISGSPAINFTAAASINVDGDKTLGAFTTTADGQGSINFTSANTLIVTGDISAPSPSRLSNITFTAAGILNAKGNIYTSGGITGTGELILSGSSAAQTIDTTTDIGSLGTRLSNVNANNSQGSIFKQNVFTNNFEVSAGEADFQDAKSLRVSGQISGSGKIKSSTSNGNVTLDGTVAQTVGIQLGDSTGRISVTNSNTSATVSFNEDLFTNDFATTTSSVTDITASKTLDVGNSITGDGLIKSSDQTANITLSTSGGTFGAQIGNIVTTNDRINILKASGSSINNFTNDIYVQSVNTDTAANIVLADTKTLDVNGNIIGTGTIRGSGASSTSIVTLSGTSAQDVASAIGASGNVIGTVNIGDHSGAVTTLNNGIFASTLNVNDNVTIDGAATIANIAAVTIASGKELILKNNSSLTGVTTQVTAGAADNGTITFAGTSAQTMGNKIGTNLVRLNQVGVTNTNGVTFSDTIHTNNFDVSSLGVANISGTTIDIDGNVSGDGKLMATTDGVGADVILSGATTQSIAAQLGDSANKLSQLTISNAANVATFSKNFYTVAVSNLATAEISSSATGLISGNVVGTGKIVSSDQTGQLTFSGSGTQTIANAIGELGKQIEQVNITNTGTVAFNEDSVINNLSKTSTSIVQIADTKSLTVAGNITGAGTIKGDATEKGSLILAGTTQDIAAKIGVSTSDRIGTLNVSSGTSTFNNTIFANNLTVGGTAILKDDVNVNGVLSGAGTVNIDSGKTLTLTGATGSITSTGSIQGTTDGVGTLVLEATANPSITAKIGTTTNKLSQVTVSDTYPSEVIFTDSINTDILTVNDDVKISGNADNNVGTVTIATGKVLAIDAAKTLAISKNVTGTGTGKIQAATNNSGVVNFNGSVAQTISSDIGAVGQALGSISVTNSETSSGVTFNNDIHTNSLIVDGVTNLAANLVTVGTGAITTTNSLGELKLTSSSAQTITATIGTSGNVLNKITTANTANDITFDQNVFVNDFEIGTSNIAKLSTAAQVNVAGNMAGGGTIQGTAANDGTLILSGTSTQTITSNIGSVSNRLGQVSVTNNIGTIFVQDVHTKALLVDGSTTIKKDIIIDDGVVTTTSGTGSITFDGDSAQSITSALGASGNKFNVITASNNADNITFTKDIYTNNFNVENTATIDTGTVSNIDIGSVAITDAKTLTVKNHAAITNINTNTSGIIDINASKTATVSGNITGGGSINSSNNEGNIVLSGVNQTISSKLGVDNANRLNEISVNSGAVATINNDITSNGLVVNGNLTIAGSVVAASNGITTANDGTGDLTLSGTSTTTISANIGTSLRKLNQLTISNSSTDGVTLSGTSLYADNFALSGKATVSDAAAIIDLGNIVINSGNELVLNNDNALGSITTSVTGGGTLSLSSSTFQQIINANTTLGASTSNRLGKLSVGTLGTFFNGSFFIDTADIAGGSTVAENGSIGTLNILNSSVVSINTTKTLDVSGAISGAGTVKGDGTLHLSGTNQAIGSSIGVSVGDRLDTLKVSNSATISNVFVDNLDTDAAGVITINSGAVADVGTSIGGTGGAIKGAGKLKIVGGITSNASLGVSTSDRLGELEVASGGFTFAGDAFLTNFTAAGTQTFTVNTTKTLDIAGTIAAPTSTIKGLGSLTLAGGTQDVTGLVIGSGTSAANRIGTLNINDSLALSNNSFITALASTNSDKILTINSGQTSNISGDITGTNFSIVGPGNLQLAGASQAIGATLGSSTARLGTLTLDGATTFTNNIFATDLVVNNTTTTINSATADISGNISGTSAIIAGTGTLNLSGTTQSVAAQLNGLGALQVSSGTTTLSTGVASTVTNTTIASGAILDVASGHTLNVTTLSGSGTIHGSGTLALNGGQTISTALGIDASNRMDILSFADSSTFGANSFIGALSTSVASKTLTVDTGKVVDVSGAISGTSMVINGAGTLKLAGGAQSIGAQLGGSASDRLGRLELTTTGTSFSNDLFLTDLDTVGTVTLASGTADIAGNITGTSPIITGAGTLKLSGTSQTISAQVGVGTGSRIGTLEVTNAAQFNNNIFTTSLVNNGTLTINDTFTADVTNNITGSGGTITGAGTLTFAGTATTSKMGVSTSDRLGNLNLTGAIAFSDDLFVGNLSSAAATTINSAKVADVSGNVTGAGSIAGDGTLRLSGTSTQTLSASIGVNTSTRLDTLEIGSSAGASISNNSFIKNIVANSDLTLSAGTANISGNISGTGSILGTGDLTLSDNGVTDVRSVSNVINLAISTVLIEDVDGVTFNNNLTSGLLVIDNGVTTQVNSNLNLSTLEIRTSSALNISSSSTATITGSVISTGTSTISNAGNLTLKGNANSATGSIANSGTLTLNAAADQNIAHDISGTGSVIVNNAQIDANNDVSLAAVTNGSLQVIDGDVTVSGAANISGDTTVASIGTLALNGVASLGNVTNSGTVTLDGATSSLNNLVNSGTVALGSGDTVTISGTVTNGGTINGAGNLVLAGSGTATAIANIINTTGAVTLSNAAGTSTSSNFAAASLNVNENFTVGGTSNTVAISGATTVASAKVLTVDRAMTTGSLVNNGTSIINQDVSSGGLTNNGTTTIAAGKILNLTGAANINASSILNIGANVTNSGKIVSNDTVTINNAATINLDYSNAGQLGTSGSYEFIETSGVLIATPGSINVTDNSLLLDTTLSTATLPNRMLANYTLNTSGLNSLTTTSAAATQDVLDFGTSGNLQIVRSSLLQLSDSASLEKAAKSLDKPHNNEVTNTAMAITTQASGVLSSHASFAKSAASASLNRSAPISPSFSGGGNSNNSGGSNSSSSGSYDVDTNIDLSGFSSGNNATYEFGAWGQAFGGASDQRDRKGEAGYDATMYGFVLGYDALKKNDTNKYSINGVALTYANANVDSKADSKHVTDIESVQLSLYNHNFKKNNLGLYNENIISVALNQHDSVRQITGLSDMAKAKYNSLEGSFQVGFGYNSMLARRFLAGPSLSLRYAQLSTDDYTETGAGNAGLVVDNSDFSTLISTLSYNMSGKLKTTTGAVIPKVSVGWIRNLKTQGSKSSTGFIAGGKSTETIGTDLIENLLNVNAQVNIPHDDNMLTFGYDLKSGSGFASHAGFIKYKVAF